ncbi:2'-5' RNA ligase [Modicisalibacter ilicicola DSM 19980]|uniref:RNA 2',3'-cyclic phosphodiesterase n=1 Tax=Modicisalibacter ilicicola DSM 19980 TaxID=1121942 RepID=A0A1M4W058_9GAMM|nr:RNA 2',3'-cyclic phosphodiesterase [Halomonas ilicicola]SHE74513.1 2'-5' RNA ligase [Halomonas ilicicola DSM 19980]
MRLFFALWPDPALRERLETLAIQAQHRCGGKRTATDKLHLTLAFLGEVPPHQVTPLVETTHQLTGPAGTWTLDRLGHFPRGGVVWAGSATAPESLAAFQKRLWSALAPLGFTPPRHAFRPHVTLVRKASRPVQADADDALPLVWPLGSASLVHSAVDGPGRRYVTLARTAPRGG